MGAIIALAASGLYVYLFLPKDPAKRDGATLLAVGFWAVVIFGVVSAMLGGNLGPLADIAAWSSGL